VGFAALSLPLDVLYYLIAGVGALFGWVARQFIGDPTPGAAAEAFAEMGVRRWPPAPVRRLARPSLVAADPVAIRSSATSELRLFVPESDGKEESDGTSQAIQ
jgi:hypothetical protein